MVFGHAQGRYRWKEHGLVCPEGLLISGAGLEPEVHAAINICSAPGSFWWARAPRIEPGCGGVDAGNRRSVITEGSVW